MLYVSIAIAAIMLLGAPIFIDRLLGVVLGFSRAETDRWSAPITWLTLVISAVLGDLFAG